MSSYNPMRYNQEHNHQLFNNDQHNAYSLEIPQISSNFNFSPRKQQNYNKTDLVGLTQQRNIYPNESFGDYSNNVNPSDIDSSQQLCGSQFPNQPYLHNSINSNQLKELSQNQSFIEDLLNDECIECEDQTFYKTFVNQNKEAFEDQSIPDLTLGAYLNVKQIVTSQEFQTSGLSQKDFSNNISHYYDSMCVSKPDELNAYSRKVSVETDYTSNCDTSEIQSKIMTIKPSNMVKKIFQCETQRRRTSALMNDEEKKSILKSIVDGQQSQSSIECQEKIVIVNSASRSQLLQKNKKKNGNSKKKNINSITKDYKTRRQKHRCTFCKKEFEKAQALGGHMSKAHPNSSPDYYFKKQVREVRTPERQLTKRAKEVYCQRYGGKYISSYRKLGMIKEELKQQINGVQPYDDDSSSMEEEQ